MYVYRGSIGMKENKMEPAGIIGLTGDDDYDVVSGSYSS